MLNFKNSQKGLAQIPIMIGLLVMAVALPLATKLIKENQDNRNLAAPNRKDVCSISVGTDIACRTVKIGDPCVSASGTKTCIRYNSSNDCLCGTSTITPIPTTVVSNICPSGDGSMNTDLGCKGVKAGETGGCVLGMKCFKYKDSNDCFCGNAPDTGKKCSSTSMNTDLACKTVGIGQQGGCAPGYTCELHSGTTDECYCKPFGGSANQCPLWGALSNTRTDVYCSGVTVGQTGGCVYGKKCFKYKDSNDCFCGNAPDTGKKCSSTSMNTDVACKTVGIGQQGGCAPGYTCEVYSGTTNECYCKFWTTGATPTSTLKPTSGQYLSNGQQCSTLVTALDTCLKCPGVKVKHVGLNLYCDSTGTAPIKDMDGGVCSTFFDSLNSCAKCKYGFETIGLSLYCKGSANPTAGGNTPTSTLKPTLKPTSVSSACRTQGQSVTSGQSCCSPLTQQNCSYNGTTGLSCTCKTITSTPTPTKRPTAVPTVKTCSSGVKYFSCGGSITASGFVSYGCSNTGSISCVASKKPALIKTSNCACTATCVTCAL
jgi:hypothetical protein